MKRLIIILFTNIALFSLIKAQTNQYLINDEQAPGNIPVIYGPGVISKDSLKIYGISFSPDGTELVFAERGHGLFYMKKVRDTWSEPKAMDISTLTHIMYPKFSLLGDFISYVDGNSKEYGFGDIFKIEKVSDNKWSKPIKLLAPINSEHRDAGHSFTSSGTIYFTSGRFDKDLPHSDIFRANLVNDSIVVELLPKFSQLSIHTDEECLYVSPDESYIIVDSWHINSKRKQDLFISFKKDDNSWTDLIRLNNKINTNEMEGIPFVTRDNNYLFFRRMTSSGSKIFWVSTKEVFKPYLNFVVPDFYEKANEDINIPISKETFKDFNGKIVDYQVYQNGSKELPSWISFDTEDMTITGKTDSPQVLHLELVATDNDINKETVDFKIVIE